MSDPTEQHPSPPPTDRQARRQGLPPNSEHWNSPPLAPQDGPDNYDAPPYEDQRGPDAGQDQMSAPQPFMRHQNRSVPAIHTQMQPDQYGENDTVPPLPTQFDPNGLADQFGNMHVGQRGQPMRGPPLGDPIPRAGTSMSMRSMQSVQSPQRMAPSSGGGLPVSPDQHMRRQPHGRVVDNTMRSNSVHSGGSGNSGYTSFYSGEAQDADTDITSLYSYDDPTYQQNGPGYGHGPMDGVPPRGYPPPPPSWNGHGHQPYAPPPQNEFNYLYSAAADVLGMGPPPGAPPPGPPMHPQYPSGPSSGPYAPPGPSSGPYPPPGPSQSPYPPPGPGPSQSPYPHPGPSPSPYAPQNYGQPLPPSQSAPYLGPGPYQPGGPGPGQGGYPSDSQTSLTRGPSNASSFQSGPPMPPPPEDDFEMTRPRLQRSETAASVNPRTQKTKAIDLSAPPYTKEYIDQYRQRIKDDPDPEAHFQYAKYLIDAAKKIGADAKDQRGLRKYRDALIAESLKVIRRLATQGQPYDEAQFFLANCHGTGMLGLQVDHERAYHLYLQAAKQNHPAACYRVAVCNEIGAGTRPDPQRAAAFYRKAASLGDTAAMYKLGVILLRGLLKQQPNPREAIGWLRRAAEQADEENPHALHELAMLYENPNNGVVPHDPAYAKELYTRAGHLGYTHSQFKLGQAYEYGSLTCPVDPRRSIAWYTKAAEKGHAEAELALSGWYLTGSEGVLKQSDSEAYLWARRAANKGLSKAEYAVGYYAEVGIGVKQDIEFAKRWYMRAAAQGNKRAMNRLTEMKRNGNKRANMARPTRQDAKDECVIV